MNVRPAKSILLAADRHPVFTPWSSRVQSVRFLRRNAHVEATLPGETPYRPHERWRGRVRMQVASSARVKHEGRPEG
jgi:hypothetical protein